MAGNDVQCDVWVIPKNRLEVVQRSDKKGDKSQKLARWMEIADAYTSTKYKHHALFVANALASIQAVVVEDDWTASVGGADRVPMADLMRSLVVNNAKQSAPVSNFVKELKRKAPSAPQVQYRCCRVKSFRMAIVTRLNLIAEPLRAFREEHSCGKEEGAERRQKRETEILLKI
jgi:hypothetical protein